jgi:hypothetical protein
MDALNDQSSIQSGPATAAELRRLNLLPGGAGGGALADRILIALGGLRDDMPIEDVRAVQRFVDRIR